MGISMAFDPKWQLTTIHIYLLSSQCISMLRSHAHRERDGERERERIDIPQVSHLFLVFFSLTSLLICADFNLDPKNMVHITPD